MLFNFISPPPIEFCFPFFRGKGETAVFPVLERKIINPFPSVQTFYTSQYLRLNIFIVLSTVKVMKISLSNNTRMNERSFVKISTPHRSFNFFPSLHYENSARSLPKRTYVPTTFQLVQLRHIHQLPPVNNSDDQLANVACQFRVSKKRGGKKKK